MSEAIIEQLPDPSPEVSEGFDQIREESDTSEQAEPVGADRDEKGRFTAKQEPPGDELLLGKFRSVDDLASGYSNLEQELGRQAQEIGWLRQQSEAPQHTLDQPTVDWFDEQIADNPQGAAVWAMRQDPSGVLYNRAMESWYEESPRQASAFERELEMGAMAKAVDQRLSSIAAPMMARTHQDDFDSAWNAVYQQHPDLPEHGDAILEAAQSAPEVVAQLQSGTLQDKQRVIENLYWLAKGRQADTLTEAAQQFASQQAQSERTAAQAAAVAPASSLAVSEGKGGDLAQRIWGTTPPSISQGLTHQ
jgi:hypothetical protein